MKAEIRVPAVGESINEATIGDWVKKSGEFVKRDDIILLLETDKASVEVVAPSDGVLTTSAGVGDTVQIGAVVAHIDTEGVASAGVPQPSKNKEASRPVSEAPQSTSKPSAPAPEASSAGKEAGGGGAHLSPAVRRVVEERGLDPSQIKGTGKDGRLTKQDVMMAKPSGLAPSSINTSPSQTRSSAPPSSASAGGLGATAGNYGPTSVPSTSVRPPMATRETPAAGDRGTRREPMSTIRKRIAERLVQAQKTAAILTTFNEVDLSAVMAMRDKYKEKYKEKYGVSLGFMGFFVRAAVEALREVPQVNAFIDGQEMVFHDYINIGVAVGTEKGLMVPVIRDADQLTLAGIELAIRDFALKAREGKITVDDLSGGTFTISNGGVYGSLLSTPILNPPQSGILGMHKIEERPVVIDGQVEVRPMMYLALSYDHRIIDGKDAVTFLVRIKEGIEDPARMLLGV